MPTYVGGTLAWSYMGWAYPRMTVVDLSPVNYEFKGQPALFSNYSLS